MATTLASSRASPTRCAYPQCGQPLNQLMKCLRCLMVSYCSKVRRKEEEERRKEEQRRRGIGCLLQ